MGACRDEKGEEVIKEKDANVTAFVYVPAASGGVEAGRKDTQDLNAQLTEETPVQYEYKLSDWSWWLT